MGLSRHPHRRAVGASTEVLSDRGWDGGQPGLVSLTSKVVGGASSRLRCWQSSSTVYANGRFACNLVVLGYWTCLGADHAKHLRSGYFDQTTEVMIVHGAFFCI